MLGGCLKMLNSVKAFWLGGVFSLFLLILPEIVEANLEVKDLPDKKIIGVLSGGAQAPMAAVGSRKGTKVPAVQSEEMNSVSPLVEVRKGDKGYQLYRNGMPYYIKGIGGTRFLGQARAAGANSVRTWSAKNIGEILERSHDNDMTVMLGIWLSHRAADYVDEAYKNSIISRVRMLLNQYKDHPALLMWALGNEVNLHGDDPPEAWQFINTLANMIKSSDPHHPVISVISFRPETLNKIALNAPDLDAVGINAYGALPKVRRMVDESPYDGPYLITEWGVTGHWEVAKTQWGRPIEPTSNKKRALYQRFYLEDILNNKDRCLGSYVFLWGQKQERTPTWYSMFINHIPGTEFKDLVCASVDAMGYNWSGNWPTRLAPEVTQMTLNGGSAHDNVNLLAGESMQVAVTADDSDGRRLQYIWEILEEPVKLGVGGGYEPRPATVGEVLQAETPEIQIPAPETSGNYRLFVYVVDEQGRVGTANIPFQVKSYQAEGPGKK